MTTHLDHSTPDTAAVPDAPTGDTATAATDPETLAAWGRVGSLLTERVPEHADREDLIVTVAPGGTPSGAPAQFAPSTATITLDAAVFGPTADPRDLTAAACNPETYPAAFGALIHEAAHAAHSAWSAAADTPRAAHAAAELLEEARIEARQITRRPADRRWLRACAIDLVLADLDEAGAEEKWAAAHCAALILGREDAGILEPTETRAAAIIAEDILGTDTLTALRTLWNEAFDVEDDDAGKMLELGRRWCATLGADPERPHPGALDSGSVSGGPGGIGAVIKAAAHATGAWIEKHDAQDYADPYATVLGERAKTRSAEQAAAQTAKRRADKVFGGHGAGHARGNPVTGTRPPTVRERAAASTLAKELRRAAYRERAETTVTSALPPGRLNMRGALARDAQRNAGSLPTAEPWIATTRRHTPTPPLRVGIAIDVSGSMAPAVGPLASAAWILAAAVHLTGPRADTATVAFGNALTAITHPGAAPALVTVFDAPDGTERPAGAVDALDASLGLTRPGAARLLVIASDGAFAAHGEPEALKARLARLTSSGCAVLHLAFTRRALPIPHSTLLVIDDPTTAPDAIGRAAAKALAG